MTEMKLCKDCHWAKAPKRPHKLRSYDFVCLHESSLQPVKMVDYVFGQPIAPRRLRCLEARNDPERCGPEGRHWEPIGFDDNAQHHAETSRL